jgi:hypothetical protein
MKGPAESGQIRSVGRRKIAKKIAKNKRCYANTLRPCSLRTSGACMQRDRIGSWEVSRLAVRCCVSGTVRIGKVRSRSR